MSYCNVQTSMLRHVAVRLYVWVAFQQRAIHHMPLCMGVAMWGAFLPMARSEPSFCAALTNEKVGPHVATSPALSA